MAKTIAELYHWGRMMYLGRYGMPIDCFDLMYRFLLIELELFIAATGTRYTDRYERHKSLTPRERYLEKLKKEAA